MSKLTFDLTMSLDKFQVHVAPLLPGDGVRLFDLLGDGQPEIEGIRVIGSPGVTQVKYRFVK
jgi:hypothetical protein